MSETSKSNKLLNKVYDHLDTIDVSKLSMRELEDFLGVVQKGRFLETVGQIPTLGFGGWPNIAPKASNTGSTKSSEQ